MKFLGSARALVFAVAVVTEVAGLGLTVLPALAAPPPPPGGGHPDITITAGGDRTSDNAVSGTAGVRFSVPNANPNDCTTASNGTCTVSSDAGSRRTVTQESAPAGWFTSPELAISPNSFTSNVAARDYSALTTNVPQSGVDVPESTSGTTTNPTARSGVWAVSRQEPVIPPHCGLNVALLFDLSFSVQGHLRQVQDAGIGYVNALAGTPSSVALYTMGTHAPVNSTNNSNFPLTPVTTSANVAALTNKIRGYTILTNPAQYTNLDQGLWQIASAEGPPGGTRVHYDAVIVISDGDPSVYGPTGIGQTFTGITRFIDIENGIFSANALKAKETKVISVGVNSSSATTLNLRAISGRVEGSDYFVTNLDDLEQILHDLALTNCAGSVNVTTAVIPLNSTAISTALPAPGWTLHATGQTVSPAVAVTNETGASSFTTSAVTEPVNVTEEVMSGHKHVPVDGKNAVCANLEGNPVPVTNTGTSTGPGFTITTQANDVITCSVYNQQLAPAVVTTKLSATGGEIPVGGSVTDSATLHGVTGTAGGTVEYRYYGSQAACQSATAASPPAGGTLVSTVTVTDGAVPPSAAPTFPAAGTFYWAAFYSGDASNLAAASDCATEPLVVTPAQSRVTTVLSAADGEISVAGSASDTATLNSVTSTAGGTVQYRHYTSLTACQSASAASPPAGGTLVSSVTVTNGTVPPSTAATFPAAGTFYWAAFYSGDTSNREAVSDCATEPLVVTQAVSRVTTVLSANDRDIAVDGSAHDTATLHGVTTTAGGTVQYRHYTSLTACQSATAASPPAGGTLVSTVTVTGGVVPPSATARFTAAGTYYWAAFYSGDTSNQADASDCATEPLVVTPAPSQLTTELSATDAEIPVDGSAHDTAALHGVTSTAGGTVEYRYYDSLTACQSATLTFPPASGGTLVSTQTVTNGAVPASAAATFTNAGTYYWAAFYSGDTSNRADTSHCATEPLVVTQAVSRVTTVLSASGGEIPVGGSATDTATLHGITSTAVGTIEFRYYDTPDACDSDVAAFPGTVPSGGTPVSTQTVTNGTAPPSAPATFPTAGTFYWAAFYSGGPNNLPSASDCATEPLVVTPAPSRVTTRLSAVGGQTPVDGSVSDTATLNGVTATAGGTVDYRYYDSLTACDTDVAAFPGTAPLGGTRASTETVTNGAAPSSVAAIFPNAGTFYWAAFYSGDADDLAAPSDCATEPLVVTQAVSRVTTVLSAPGGKIPVGGSASDTATLHGITSTAVGTIEFRYYDTPDACDSDVAAFPGTAPTGGTPVSTQTVTNGAAPPSAAVTFPTAGTFYWAAFYSGGPNNLPSASDCATEPLVVNLAASQVTTELSAADREITVGNTASDTATLNGVTPTAGGTVDYRYYDSQAACDGDVATFPRAPVGGTDVSTETVTNGAVPSSAAATFPTAGTFYWAAFYSGDPNNRADASHCAAEPLVVTPAQSQVTTALSPAGGEIAVDGSASDAATLTSVTGTAGGTVDYRLYGSPSACDGDVAAFPGTAPSGGTQVSKETVTNGTAPSSAARRFGAAGTFYWAAFYSGDANNRADASDCTTEPLVVTPAQSQVTTQLSATDGQTPVGGSATDTATLHDVTATAGGTVEYRYYGSQAACETDVAAFPGTAPSGGTPVSTESVTNGAVPRSSAVTFPDAGTVYWTAFYSGDVANLPVASDCATEPLVVTQAQSRVTTVLSVAGGQFGVGGSASDTATLTGVAGTAGGTVEYRFYDSLSACESDVAGFRGTAPSGGTPVSTETVTNGAVPPSAVRTFPVAGTFYWAAFYSGDPNNRAAASDCDSEPLVVTPAQSRVTTHLSAASGEIAVGGTASDSATLLEVAGTAGGTMEYHYYDSLAACQSATAASPPAGGTLVSTETVAGGVAPQSAAATFPDAGTFYWAAFYSGDANDAPAASDCATEPLVVNAAQSQVTTQLSAANGEVPVDGTASDAATLTGVTGTAGGTMEYRYYDSLTACDSDVAAFTSTGTAPSGGTPVSTQTVTNGAVPSSAAQTFPDAGTFYWAAFYSGDKSNQADASDCATEPLVVTAAQSQLTTQLSDADREIPAGGSTSDTAALTGVTSTAGGTVEYRFYDSLSACQTASAAFPPASGGTLVSTVTVTDGTVPPSAAHTFSAAGTVYWAAFYSGDPDDLPDTGHCATEPLVVTAAPSQVTTELSAADAEITSGGSATDTATLHGVTGTAGGTVEYRLYTSPSPCDSDAAAFPGATPSHGTPVSTQTVTNGVAPPSAAYTFTAAGTFYWAAFYSGDPSNQAAASDCATEPLVVALGPPASVIVHMDWVIDGVVQRVPSQDPDFQASLVLSTPAPAPGGPHSGASLVTARGSSGAVTPLAPAATWGQEQFGYAVGQDIHIALADETIPPGCSHTVAGHLGVQTIDQSKDEFLVTATATCDQAPTGPGEEGTHLTLVKRISNLLGNPAQVPLTSWTLTARPESGGPPVISGTTGVSGNVQPGVPYVLAESAVPGYKQLPDPALLKLVPGATGSWRCVETGPGGSSGLQDFDGGTGDVIVQPGRHVTCTALNRRTLAIPVGPAQTGGGLAAAARSGPALATGLALMAAGALLGLGGLRLRRRPRSAPRA